MVKLDNSVLYKQEPIINDKGILIPVNDYVPEGYSSEYRLIITKEIFIEAHNKYINNKRMYKGGWKR